MESHGGLSPGVPVKRPAAVVLLIVTRGAHRAREGGALAEPSRVLSGVLGSFNTIARDQQEDKLPRSLYAGMNLPAWSPNTFLYQAKVITQDDRQVKKQTCSFNTAFVTIDRTVAPRPRSRGRRRGSR
jgi:hypothetical protein